MDGLKLVVRGGIYIGSIILGAVYFHKVDRYEQVIAYASKGNQILGWPSIMTALE